MTNTSKSVYSFEGEILSEDDDEYNSDSSIDTKDKQKDDGMLCPFAPQLQNDKEMMIDEIKSSEE